jgi:apolipoprotein N-acyltransferase
VIICAAGTWLGFANPVWHLPGLVLTMPVVLGWSALQARSPRQAFVRGWLAASAAYATALYWVSIPIHEFGSLPWIAAIPCPVLIGLYIGLYAGLYCFILSWAAFRLHWGIVCLLAWFLWTSLEYLREVLFTGFPWLGLAQALAPFPQILQGASLIGAHGISGLLAGLGLCIVLGFQRAQAWLTAAVAVGLILFFGAWHLHQPKTKEVTEMPTALIQGNIEQSMKWDPAFQQETLHRYVQMSKQTMHEHGTQFVIWPETALPFYLQENAELTSMVQEFCRNEQALVLTGSPGYSLASGGTRVLYHNQAYLLGPAGTVLGKYSKEHLVPFGEYIPFGRYLPFLQTLVHGVGSFHPGKHTAPLVHNNLAIGCLICYETIFSSLVQQRVVQGANILVNLSNDAWFGRSSGARQHLHQAVLRTIEQGRYMLRATNTGISAVIDCKGRIQDHSAWFTPAVIRLENLELLNRQTFFSRYFSFVRSGFFLLTLCCILLTRFHWAGNCQL